MAKITPVGRVSFPELFEPTQFKGQGDFKFRVTLIFEPNAPGLEQLRKDVLENAKAKWPAGIPKNWQDPFIDGDSLDKPECAGKVVVRFTANDDRPPGILNADKSPITKESGLLYSGCYARLSYNCFSYDHGKVGTSCGMNNVQKTGDGDALDGRTMAEDDFDAVELTSVNASDDDEMPF